MEQSKEQLAYLKRLKEMSNSDLLLEYTQMAGGDDYDGCYTESGQWEWEQLQKELNDRLVKVGFINNQNSNL